MIGVPEWLRTELQAIGADCGWSRWGNKNYVIPLAGMPFFRYNRLQDGRLVAPGTPGSYVSFRYDGEHREHARREFKPPSRCITEGRLVIFQVVRGRPERIIDLVEETGEPVEAHPMVLGLLAQRRDAWDRLEAQMAAEDAEREKAEEQAGEETLAAGHGAPMRGAVTAAEKVEGQELMGETADMVFHEMIRPNVVYMNQPGKQQKAAFTVVDRRRHVAPPPPSAA